MAYGEFAPGTLNITINTPSGQKTFDVTDFGPYPIYSSAIVATTQSAEIRFFNYGRGSPKPGAGGATATKLDTNMESSNGQLDAATEMLIYSMRIMLPPIILLADIQNYLGFTYNALYIATQKPSAEGRTEFFPAAGGIFGKTTATNQQQWTNGLPASNASRVFATPHYLGGLVSFSTSNEFPNGALALSITQNVMMVLDGLRKRNVA